MFLPNTSSIFVAGQPIDLRKSINELTIAVIETLDKKPQTGSIFVFYNKREDKIKILYWDRNGFCLWYKRLEKGKFLFPKISEDCVELSARQLQWLLDGLDFTKLTEYKNSEYSTFF